MLSVVRWASLALLGVALAVALTVAALQLTNQHVGLAGEPVGAGAELAPVDRSHTTPPTTPRTTTTPTPTAPTVTTPTTSTPAPSTGGLGGPGDDGGGGDGGGDD